MTDTIQTGNPQQGQSGQQHHDDILGEEDIFATIPQANIHEEDLPYGDMLEKKYQFEPIPEFEEEVVMKPQPTTTTPFVSTPAQKPVPERYIEPVVQQEMQDIQQASSLQQTQVTDLLDTKFQTDIQKKFGDLFFMTKKIYELRTKLGMTEEETFDILGADNDKIFVSYRFLIDENNEPMLFITKIEQDKSTEEETMNELRLIFNEETSSIEIMVNDTLIFDEIMDLTEDPKKKMQVMEKLNKFIFLASEESRKLEKEIQMREEEERERKKLQDIFRNF